MQLQKIHSGYNVEDILQRSEEVFRYYFRSDFLLGTYYRSPLRNWDSKPSFNIFEGKGTLIYKDWGGTTGNCINFVMELRKMSFQEALELIQKEVTSNIRPDQNSSSRIHKSDTMDKVAIFFNTDRGGRATYTETDKWYWQSLHKTPLGVVSKNRIYSVKEVRIEERTHILSMHKFPVYYYQEFVDGCSYYKIYAPFSKDKKWLSNMKGVTTKAVGGMHLLPKKGKELIITKSVKDRVVLYGLGFIAVSTQGEDIDIDKEILDDLKERFDEIYLLYDNDYNKEVNVGKLLGDKYQEKWGVGRILIPEDMRYTDVSEMIQKFTPHVLKELINKWKITK